MTAMSRKKVYSILDKYCNGKTRNLYFDMTEYGNNYIYPSIVSITIRKEVIKSEIRSAQIFYDDDIFFKFLDIFNTADSLSVLQLYSLSVKDGLLTIIYAYYNVTDSIHSKAKKVV